MRYRFVRGPVPGVAAVAAVALLASLALAGCGQARSDRPAAPTTAAEAEGGSGTDGGTGGGGATGTTTGTPPATNSGQVVLADGRHPAFLKDVDLASRTIVIDVVQFFTGTEAAKAASQDGQESPPPDDYYIRNANKRLRSLPVLPTARITVNVLAGDETGDATKDLPIDLAKLASYFPSDISPLFWVTVRGDQIAALQEQFLP
jgi:hypothetical protein